MKPDVALKALPILLEVRLPYPILYSNLTLTGGGFLNQDMTDTNPLIRALALRTVSYIHVKEFVERTIQPLKKLMSDSDPYVRKTSAFCVAKLYDHDKYLVERSDLIDKLNRMLQDENPTVVASALAALMDIWERSESIKLTIDYPSASKIVSILPDCSEYEPHLFVSPFLFFTDHGIRWGQTYILESLMAYVPQESSQALLLAERITPRLSHTNSAVVLTCIRVILYLMNYIADDAQITQLSRKLSPPLVTLLAKGSEIQYLALRNAILILQRRPEVLRNNIRVFFCKYNDPIYVKVTKLELIFMLADKDNITVVLTELREYATEIDVQFVRKAVRAIGKLAIKIEPAARQCIETLLDLVNAKIPYVVQEATVVIRNIFRKYPNQYESIITTVIANIDDLDESEAKAAIVWIIGQYADRIENADDLLKDYLATFHDEPVEVQLALLTATVKLFIQRPTKGSPLVPQVLKWCTEETDDPDLRDRGYMYWRLLSTDPETAKKIVMGPKPPITAESEKLDPVTLEELCLNVGTLATIYLKPVQQVFRTARPRKLIDSPALVRRKVEMKTALDQAQAFTTGQVPAGENPTEADQTSRLNKHAADAADAYFNGLGRERMSLMSLGGGGGVGDMLTSPTGAVGQQAFSSQGGTDLLD
jgi:AP-2 complex subunit beta-1